MLSKQFKLDLRKETTFFSKCKRKHFSFFSLFYTSSDKSGVRFSVIIPKKHTKLASHRNQQKRIIYFALEEAIKKNFEKIDFNKNLNIIIVINKNIKDIKKEEIVKKIEGGLLEITA